eukprot:Hpha_TRINITY_DN3888_c0_g1::TRINITY_DN3888_c0_g1_i1::g.44685::m.44685
MSVATSGSRSRGGYSQNDDSPLQAGSQEAEGAAECHWNARDDLSPIDVGYEGPMSPLPTASTSPIRKRVAKPDETTPREISWFDEVRVSGENFVDEKGRVLQLRGVNLGGGSKTPIGGETHNPGGLDLDFPVTFVGRPFPVEDASEHFRRLRSWGFTMVRFIITWEAIEHAGPGRYDRDYIDYVRVLVDEAARFNIYVYVDPHQDVWCRWTGGDGAPLWTLQAAGFNPLNLEVTGAALTHQRWPKPSELPKMLWPTNYFKLCCQTMFTLFFAGKRFAPQRKAFESEVQIQDYLQEHYINAMAQLAERLGECKNVVGWGPMNEPSPGYIGHPNLNKLWGPLRNDAMPTAAQAMAAGDGITQKVSVYLRIGMPKGSRVLNPSGARAWDEGIPCVWRQHGVWGVEGGRPVLRNPEYFAKADFGKDHWIPFAQRFAEGIRAASARGGRPDSAPELVTFVELPPHDLKLCSFPDCKELSGTVNAAHWYDNMTLFLGSYFENLSFDVQRGRPQLGGKNVREMLNRQLGELRAMAAPKRSFGPRGAPTLIGEVGIPFNMHGGKSYKSGDWSKQVQALDASIAALEANLLHFTLWNYNPDHSDEWGDNWNREDLSIFSRRSGGRALEAVVRPYPVAVAGRPLLSRFDLKKLHFRLRFEDDGEARPDRETLIFVPSLHFPREFVVEASDGAFTVEPCFGGRLIRYSHSGSKREHTFDLTPS